MSQQSQSKFYFLQYDIPKSCKCPNPSSALRRRLAMRIGGSVWVVREDRIPHNLINLLASYESAGLTFDLVAFDSADNARTLAMIRRSLLKEIEKAITSCRKSIEKLTTKTEESEAINRGDDYAAKCRGIIKRTEKKLADYIQAATMLEIDVNAGGSLGRLASIRAEAVARAAIYAGLTEQVQGTPLEAAATADDVPAGVLADYIEETTGDDMSSVHEAFSSGTCTVLPATPSMTREAWDWRYHAARKLEHVLSVHEMEFYWKAAFTPEETADLNDTANREYAALVG